jgi:septal ring factor EnvC (AmiA/AmiB activator)
MAKLKQASLFDEDYEFRALREKERKLAEAQKEFQKLPAILAKQKLESEATMPPMAEIKERQKFNRFEQSLSRGQIENVLRTQRQSFGMMLLLIAATILMVMWALRIIAI